VFALFSTSTVVCASQQQQQQNTAKGLCCILSLLLLLFFCLSLADEIKMFTDLHIYKKHVGYKQSL